jgi:hypothetical protein
VGEAVGTGVSGDGQYCCQNWLLKPQKFTHQGFMSKAEIRCDALPLALTVYQSSLLTLCCPRCWMLSLSAALMPTSWAVKAPLVLMRL